MDKTSNQALSGLSYEPETGAITDGHRLATGRPMPIGYLRISRGGKSYYAHRVAWLLMTGEWPGVVDHVNGDRADNRWSNLRLATPSQNSANARRAGINTTGRKGVTPYRGRFRAQICVCGQRKWLGDFTSIDEAASAYARAATDAFGEFARVS